MSITARIQLLLYYFEFGYCCDNDDRFATKNDRIRRIAQTRHPEQTNFSSLALNTRGFGPSTTTITNGRGCCDYDKFYGNVVVVIIVTEGSVAASGVIIPRSLVGKEKIKKKSYQSAVVSMIRGRARVY